MAKATRPKPIEIGPVRASPMNRSREQDGVLRWYWRARRKGIRDLEWAAGPPARRPSTSSPTA